MRIAVLMTCHNRREQTLRCLASLRDEVKVKGEGEQWKFDIFLVDDGCTDGTGEKVKELGEGQQWTIHLIKGSGRDYWAKGMARAWQAALDYEKENYRPPSRTSTYTHFLWLNDDAALKPDAIKEMTSALELQLKTPTVIVGSMQDGAGKKLYGVLENGLFCGNCVLVPREAYEKVGMIDGCFAQGWADMDYAMRCQKAGVKIVEVGPVGTCAGHPMRPWLKGVGFKGRFRMLVDPKGWNVHDVWRFQLRHFGLVRALASCVHLVFHVLRGRD